MNHQAFVGVPLGDVSAIQYVSDGQSNLFTRVRLTLSHCSEDVLGTRLWSGSSSLPSFSSCMFPFFFSFIDTPLKKKAAFEIPENRQDSF